MILFTLIARKKTVLAEYTPRAGNFTTLTRVILSKIADASSTPARMSYNYDDYRFHYVMDNGIIYLCLTERTVRQNLAFTYLEDIKQRFQSMYRDRVQTAIAFAMNGEFSRIIAERMKYYNENPNSDAFSTVHKKLEDVRGVLISDIDKLLDRGQKIEILVDKAEQLSSSANMFERSADNLRRTMWWKSMKMKILFAFIILVVIYLIVSFICGFDFSKCSGK